MKTAIAFVVATVVGITAVTAAYAGCRYKCWTDSNGGRHCQYTCE